MSTEFVYLPRSLTAWNSPAFEEILKQEVEQLGAGQLPLQQGLTIGSYALEDGFSTMVIAVADTPGHIHATLGIFFLGVIAGCNCADDPSPVEAHREYCEVSLAIDKVTAKTVITLQA